VLSAEEQRFLDVETTELCRLTRDWECTQKQDMPDEVWRYIKDKGFLGMIIPANTAARASRRWPTRRWSPSCPPARRRRR
jgi:alkylation response protein AidB-like acyl-CoA dehydrogenase